MTPDITIGMALKRFRESCGMTQEQMGYATGLGKNMVANLEVRNSNPTMKTLAHFSVLGFRFGIEKIAECNGSLNHSHLARSNE